MGEGADRARGALLESPIRSSLSILRVRVVECAMAASPIVFDRALLRRRRRRAMALGPTTFLLERVAEDLGDRLATVLRRFDLALDLGTPGDAVRRVLAQSGR